MNLLETKLNVCPVTAKIIEGISGRDEKLMEALKDIGGELEDNFTIKAGVAGLNFVVSVTAGDNIRAAVEKYNSTK